MTVQTFSSLLLADCCISYPANGCSGILYNNFSKSLAPAV
ncbi:hypothetical protein D920_03000 [Enterococcus faecalis 13-SD-W-01]|nr:hypothetical protein D920_03000 [Enterococcus faecalis 13-SD-W-01]